LGRKDLARAATPIPRNKKRPLESGLLNSEVFGNRLAECEPPPNNNYRE
jgi:hypothetical protein